MLIQYEYKGDECPDIDKVLLINVIRMILNCVQILLNIQEEQIFILVLR